MEVILLQRIEKLGQIGDLVKVKPGYARNFLIPLGKCLRATEDNKKVFAEKKAEIELQNLTLKKEAESVLTKVSGYHLTIVKNAGESGHLYGSVKSQDIAKSLTDSGYNLDKSQVLITEPIKTIGVFETKIALHPEVHAFVLVNIARSTDEATAQFQKYKKELNKDKNKLPTSEEYLGGSSVDMDKDTENN